MPNLVLVPQSEVLCVLAAPLYYKRTYLRKGMWRWVYICNSSKMSPLSLHVTAQKCSFM